jgi:hypothetical protein
MKSRLIGRFDASSVDAEFAANVAGRRNSRNEQWMNGKDGLIA